MKETAMEINQNVSAETKRIVEKSIGRYELTYKHNGAEVFIATNPREGDYGYDMTAYVCVVKNGKPLTFSIAEHVGNKHGTIFTKANVGGLPERSDAKEDPSKGMYAYEIFTKKYDQKEGDDIMTRAATIYSHYDKETDGKIAIGKVFKSYVPTSYEGIKKELGAQAEQAKEIKQQVAMNSQMAAFMDKFHDF